MFENENIRNPKQTRDVFAGDPKQTRDVFAGV